MKLTIKRGDAEFSLESSDHVFNGVGVEEFFGGVEKLTTHINKELLKDPIPKQIAGFEKSSGVVFDNKVESHNDRESFSIRQRLPNNVVDISSLNIKQAVTESALVRCPHCGQSHAIVLMDNSDLCLMRRNYSNDEFGIVSIITSGDGKWLNDVCANGESTEDKLNYFFKLQGMGFMEDKDFNVTNDTEIFCPVCKQSSSFFRWKDAYEHKEDYFEHQYICGACGGECLMDAQTEKDGNNTVVCTQCGRKWIKEQT